MRAIITGATSFIGLATVKEFLKAGHKVTAVIRPNSEKYTLLEEHKNLNTVSVALEHIEELLQFFNQDSEDEERVFIHFGWAGVGSEGRSDGIIQKSNIDNSIKALKTAAAIGCRRFLFAGSQAEYGIYDLPAAEETKCAPVSEYGKAKFLFGEKASVLCSELSMEYIHMRIFSVYGPGDHEWSLVSSCLDAFTHGKNVELSSCTQSWNFLYVKDAALAVLELASSKKAAPGTYNIAGDDTRILKSFVEDMYSICGNKGSFHYGETIKRSEGPASLIPDITKIVTKTNWRPVTDFKTGIKLTLKSIGRTCLACKSILPHEALMILENAPASAQDIPDDNDIKTDKGITLRLCQCKNCGLVQLDNEPVDYYRDVIRAGGFSTTMVELRRRQYRHLIDSYGLKGRKFIEVGCGRGEFLKVLTEFPVSAHGIEHKEELADIGRKDGLDIKCMFAEDENTVFEDGPYDVFLSFNFLEHQPYPSDMLKAIYNNLTPEGMGLITVPSFEYILEHDGYYELIRDHLAYYTFDTLEELLDINGFEVLEKETVNRDTCSVTVKKKSTPGCLEKGIQKKSVINADVKRLSKSFDIIDKEVHDRIKELETERKTMAIWGASHQGFTLAATTKLSGSIKYIIDSAPFKQGRYAPASHIPIVSPDYFFESPVDTILIVAPGYTEEISGIIRKKFGRQVNILVLKSNHIQDIDEDKEHK